MEVFVVGGLVAFGLFLVLLTFVLWVWTLVDVLRIEDESTLRTGTQLIWVIVIVFTQIIGSLIYLVIGRPVRKSTAATPPTDGEQDDSRAQATSHGQDGDEASQGAT